MACAVSWNDLDQLAVGHVGQDHIAYLRGLGWETLASGLTIQYRTGTGKFAFGNKRRTVPVVDSLIQDGYLWFTGSPYLGDT